MVVQPAATARPWRIKKLNVEVHDRDIVITLPGTKFMVTGPSPTFTKVQGPGLLDNGPRH
jgi:hypothetical protein